jgi:hypothetical protein
MAELAARVDAQIALLAARHERRRVAREEAAPRGPWRSRFCSMSTRSPAAIRVWARADARGRAGDMEVGA